MQVAADSADCRQPNFVLTSGQTGQLGRRACRLATQLLKRWRLLQLEPA